MFSLAFAGLALGAVFGASRVLGKYWAQEVYLTILGGNLRLRNTIRPSAEETRFASPLDG